MLVMPFPYLLEPRDYLGREAMHLIPRPLGHAVEQVVWRLVEISVDLRAAG
jgi:hypothetical protein